MMTTRTSLVKFKYFIIYLFFSGSVACPVLESVNPDFISFSACCRQGLPITHNFQNLRLSRDPFLNLTFAKHAGKDPKCYYKLEYLMPVYGLRYVYPSFSSPF
jgi:hypothetical protein